MYVWRFEIDANGCTCSVPKFSLAILIALQDQQAWWSVQSLPESLFFCLRFVVLKFDSLRIEPLTPGKLYLVDG